MKKTLIGLLLSLIPVLCFADQAFRDARYDGFKVLAPAEGSIVMIGNSITDMHCWPEVFTDKDGNYLPIVSRGVSGSYSTEQSANLESYLVNAPAKVFMMIGTNDIATSGGLNLTPDQVLSYVKSIVTRIHKRSPMTHVYLYPILKNNTTNRVEATWLEYNTKVKAYVESANDELLTFIDIYDALAGIASGGTASYDKLHLTAASYKIWCDAILPYLGTGIKTVYDNVSDVVSEQQNGGLSNSHGMRATYFSVMPIKTNDVLVFGDGEIKTGEWQELLGNYNVKNRGTGWESGGSISTTTAMANATFASVDGVTKETPKACFLYTGTSDCTGSADINTVKANYITLVNTLAAKTGKLYLMALHPNSNAASNTRIVTLNTAMDSIASANSNITFVDTYTDLSTSSGTYISGNYLYGKGYVKFAQKMVAALQADFPSDTYTCLTDDEAATRYEQMGYRNQIGAAITAGQVITPSDEVGCISQSVLDAYEEKVAEAYTLLDNSSITSDDANSMINTLKATLTVTAPTKDNTSGKYFRLYTPNRGSRYLTCNGAGATMTGTTLTSYDTQVWQLEGRDDGSFDVKSAYDGSYMAMTSPITTTKDKPTNGWTFGECNTTGLFIIKSGTNQLNQQNQSPYNILNWGSGTTLNDDGCNYKIVEVDADDFTHPVVEDGKHYTIAGYVARNGGTTNYVLYDGTTRSMTTTVPEEGNNKAVWKAVKSGSGWMFESMQSQGNYLTYDGVSSTGVVYSITDGVADGCVSMRPGDSYYAASSETGLMGGIYKSSSNKVQSTSYNWSTDWKITETIYVASEEEVVLPDTVNYTINSSTFTSYRNGTTASTGTTFVRFVKSNTTPTLQFGNSSTANNMNWVSANAGANAQIFTGGSTCTYALTAPTGYVISSYSLTATNSSGNTNDMTLTVGDKTYHTLTAQSISASIVDESSVSFVLTGANKGVTLSDFKVTIVKDVPRLPQVSTDTEKHWYYIVNAAASTVTYCTGKVVYTDPTDNDKMKWGTKTFDANHIWCFLKDASTGKYAIKSYSGKYFGTAGSTNGNSSQFNAVSKANYAYQILDSCSYFVITDGGVPLHAQQSSSVLVRWPASEGNASLWRFKEVDCSEPEAAISNTTVQQGRVTTGIGNTDLPIIRSTITVTGLEGTANLKAVSGKVVATSVSDVTKVKAYMASNSRELVTEGQATSWREANATLLGSTTTIADDGTYTVTFDEAQSLAPGTYYLWITEDISESASEGNTVDATITSYNIGGNEVAEEGGNPNNAATIFLSEGTVLMPKDKGVDKTNGSTYFRIPAITQVQKDGKTRLVTLTDDRKEHNSDLPSHCYVVGQYSDDLGKTWSEPQVVAGTVTTGGDYGHGDASLVTNRDNGDIIGIMTSAGTYGHGFFAGTAAEPPLWKTVVSHDGGETWEAPVNHTDELFGAGCSNDTTKAWLSGFSGSGAALQKRDGTLVSSFVNRQTDDGTTTQNFYFFMSKDGGLHWYRSGNSGTTAADEPKTLERNNGDLAISVRASGYNYHNVSSDNGLTWKNPAQTRFTSGISGNACDGEYMVWCSSKEGNQVADGVGDIALQTIPNSGSRQNVSIALSTDEGETFGSPKTICPSGSAYSAAVVLPDGTLGVYYEENGIFGGYTMRFVRFSLNWASSGTYKFTDEHPFVPIASTRLDANGDGKKNVDDVKKVAEDVYKDTKLEHKTSVDTRTSDINYDGDINIVDTVKVVNGMK